MATMIPGKTREFYLASFASFRFNNRLCNRFSISFGQRRAIFLPEISEASYLQILLPLFDDLGQALLMNRPIVNSTCHLVIYPLRAGCSISFSFLS